MLIRKTTYSWTISFLKEKLFLVVHSIRKLQISSFKTLKNRNLHVFKRIALIISLQQRITLSRLHTTRLSQFLLQLEKIIRLFNIVLYTTKYNSTANKNTKLNLMYSSAIYNGTFIIVQLTITAIACICWLNNAWQVTRIVHCRNNIINGLNGLGKWRKLSC